MAGWNDGAGVSRGIAGLLRESAIRDIPRKPLRVSALTCASAVAGSAARVAISSGRSAAVSAGLIASVNRAMSPLESCAEFLDLPKI